MADQVIERIKLIPVAGEIQFLKNSFVLLFVVKSIKLTTLHVVFVEIPNSVVVGQGELCGRNQRDHKTN